MEPAKMDVDFAIRERKTTKVLSESPFPVRSIQSELQELLELAGMAPFHRACEEHHRGASSEAGTECRNGIEPWRFHCLLAEQCRELIPHLDPDKAGKIPAMLRSADALILATWLPNRGPDDVGQMFEPTLANMEHIAAASSAVQNLLVAATSRGITNYWSSGGVLRSPELFARLGIPSAELLIGAVFLFPDDTRDAIVVGSKLREKRSSVDGFTRWVESV